LPAWALEKNFCKAQLKAGPVCSEKIPKQKKKNQRFS
jgi:hypothetical protein